jgi:glutathione S-transferase
MTWERGGGQLRKPATAVGDGRRRAAPLTSGNPWEETNMDKLYYASGTCALASHIALEEAGADYSAVRLDFKANQQQSPDYLKINPKGRVPALVTDKGILTETPAILAYIAQTFPKAKLAPTDDPFAFAKVQSFNNYLCATVHVAHAHKGRGYRWATDEQSFADMKRMVPKSMGACFALIENSMLRGPWVMGEQYTICDPYLYTIETWLEGDGVDMARLPKVADHHQRMAQRAAVKQALAEAQA